MEDDPSAKSLSYARVAAIGALACFGLLGIFAWHTAHPMGWERTVIDAVDRHPVPLAGVWITIFEPIPFLLLVTGLATLAAIRGQRRLVGPGVAACLGAVVAAEVVFKPLVDRVREHVGGLYHVRIIRVAGPMFPSAHTTAAAACAMFAWFIFGRRAFLAPLFALVPLLVACAVIVQRMHYPADALGGMLLGGAIVYLVVDSRARKSREATVIDTVEPDAAAEREMA